MAAKAQASGGVEKEEEEEEGEEASHPAPDEIIHDGVALEAVHKLLSKSR